ncbi:MAG: 30S ribosomal protein S16 [Chlamydiales bacterium]
MLKIRMCQTGRLNRKCYRLVVTDAKSPRDGKYIEMVGSYNPHQDNDNVKIQEDRLIYWLEKGAMMTEKAKALVKRTAPQVLKK